MAKGKKTGGRVKGTPNKKNAIKEVLREHSEDYFARVIPPEEVNDSCFIDDKDKAAFVARNKGKLFSQYDIDCMSMKPADRAKAEIDLLNYHTPKMQATAVDLAVNEENMSMRERLARLAKGEEILEEEV